MSVLLSFTGHVYGWRLLTTNRLAICPSSLGQMFAHTRHIHIHIHILLRRHERKLFVTWNSSINKKQQLDQNNKTMILKVPISQINPTKVSKLLSLTHRRITLLTHFMWLSYKNFQNSATIFHLGYLSVFRHAGSSQPLQIPVISVTTLPL